MSGTKKHSERPVFNFRVGENLPRISPWFLRTRFWEPGDNLLPVDVSMLLNRDYFRVGDYTG